MEHRVWCVKGWVMPVAIWSEPVEELNVVQKVIIWTPPVLLAITLHEVAHGRMAWQLGDPTARNLGRLSLNPLRHIDPMGTVVVPLVLLVLGGFLFGWAKAVPVDTRYLRRPLRDMALVALAGPLANVAMAFLWAVLCVTTVNLQHSWPSVGLFLFEMGKAGVAINTILAVLNLLPIPPLDGSRVLVGLLPGLARPFASIEPYGMVVLVVLMVAGVLSAILAPLIDMLTHLIFMLLGYG